MIQIEFIFQNKKHIIDASENSILEKIFKQYNLKKGKELKNIYFKYKGKRIDLKKTFLEIASDEDKKKKKISLNVMKNMTSNNINKEENKIIEKPKNIICPKCGEDALISINNYKITLYDCKNKHFVDNISLNKFRDTQKKIIPNIYICDNCYEENKNIYQNQFYRCIFCKKNFCNKCKLNHNKMHSIINYEELNYICDRHNNSYELYCKLCKKNLCKICINEHNGHEIIPFQSFLTSISNIKEELGEMRKTIDSFKKVINFINNVLANVVDNMELYYIINCDIYNSFKKNHLKFEVLSNINDINDNYKLKDIEYIINQKNIATQFSLIYDIYKKMNFKDSSDSKIIEQNNIDEQRSEKTPMENRKEENNKEILVQNPKNENENEIYQNNSSNMKMNFYNEKNSFLKNINNININNSINIKKYNKIPVYY